MSVTVSERLTAFLGEWSSRGAPVEAMHEAKRLILNQLKASVAATTNPAVTILHDWARAETRPNGGAHALWFGSELSPAHAAVVNGALFEVLDFHDTYIPTFMHAVSAVLPAVLALAEAEGPSGARVLNALALGLEVELAIATILMPTAYYRGYVPAGLVGGVGAAAACSVLAGLDEAATRNALGLAMCTAFGLYESVGSMGLAYVTGATARSGLTAFELARRGLDAPPTAFEGDKGMLVTHSDEDAAKIETVLASLGGEWRIHGQSYKTVPTETITHPVVECVLALVARARGRTLDRMTFAVQPIVVTIADERRDRFGAPSSELMARFDLRFCAAAAWVRGVFTLAEMRKAAYTRRSARQFRRLRAGRRVHRRIHREDRRGRVPRQSGPPHDRRPAFGPVPRQRGWAVGAGSDRRDPGRGVGPRPRWLGGAPHRPPQVVLTPERRNADRGTARGRDPVVQEDRVGHAPAAHPRLGLRPQELREADASFREGFRGHRLRPSGIRREPRRIPAGRHGRPGGTGFRVDPRPGL
jgi:2-methylcitrate dehydratase PrpD